LAEDGIRLTTQPSRSDRVRSEWWAEGKIGRDSSVRYRFACDVRVIFVDEEVPLRTVTLAIVSGIVVDIEAGGPAGLALRLNVNLDLGVAEVRRSSRVFSNALSC
jgi:hypothetical protein